MRRLLIIMLALTASLGASSDYARSQQAAPAEKVAIAPGNVPASQPAAADDFWNDPGYERNHPAEAAAGRARRVRSDPTSGGSDLSCILNEGCQP